ncbi:ABC transporter ATP-binding protein [Spirochaetia bacterium]|nr:ABC transporter ATP-binding protein [Spirochaetia bacterium]
MTGNNYAVSAKALCAGYGQDAVLDGLNINIESGSITGLCGPNGVGKSTFLKLCLGMLRPQSGTLRVLDEMPGANGFRKTRFRIGYVPQSTIGGTLPTTVREAALMGRYGLRGLFRAPTKEDKAKADAAIEACGISALKDRLMRELSGGQTQRAAIARALTMDAELFLLDEPTASLDAQGSADLVRILKKQQKERHITAIVVSHNAATLCECDTIYRFQNGNAKKENSYA